MELIVYHGRLAATVEQDVTTLAKAFAVMEDDHPERRFVLAMASYAEDIVAGSMPGEYDDAVAAYAARVLLIDGDTLIEHWECPDHALAEAFNVPLDQIALARQDVRRSFDF